MFKILALTDVSKDSDTQEDETITQVTKEAQVIESFELQKFLLFIWRHFLGDNRCVRIHESLVTEAEWQIGIRTGLV